MSVRSSRRAGTGGAARRLRAAFGVMAQHWRTPAVEVGPLAPGFVPAQALFADDRFVSAMLARQQAATPGLDARGAAAFFVTEYANLLGIVAASPYLSHDLVPDLAPDRTALAFELTAEGPPRVRLRCLTTFCATTRPPGAGCRLVARCELRDALRGELVAHMEPLIDRLQARTGLPWQAMWRLVADAVAARFLEAGHQFDREEAAKQEAMAILKAPGSPLANRQLHYFEVVIHDDASPRRVLARRSFRARGGCCRFYTAPGGSYCTTCVLVPVRESRHRIEAQMRRRLGLPAAGDGQASEATLREDKRR